MLSKPEAIKEMAWWVGFLAHNLRTMVCAAHSISHEGQ